MRFHDLHHECASQPPVQGVLPRVVMENPGNSQISLTMNTYSHVPPVMQRDAVIGWKQPCRQFLALVRNPSRDVSWRE